MRGAAERFRQFGEKSVEVLQECDQESIRRHAQEEETQWFPRVKEILDEKKRALLTGKVDREKAMVG